MYLTQISGITGKTLSPCFSKNPSTMSMTHGNIATLNFFLLQIHLFTNSNSKGLQSIIKGWHLWKKGITKCPVLENDLSANFHLTRDLFAWSSLKSNNWKTKKKHKYQFEAEEKKEKKKKQFPRACTLVNYYTPTSVIGQRVFKSSRIFLPATAPPCIFDTNFPIG